MNTVTPAPAISRKAYTAVAATLALLGVGVAFTIRGENNTQIGIVDPNGNAAFSGSLASERLANCNTIDGTSTGMLVCGTDEGGVGSSYTAGQGLTLTSTSFSVNSTLTGSMLRFLTVSGSLLKAKTTLASSGTLVFEGAASGSSLFLGTSLKGAGLSDCDDETETLNWDDTTGRFSCLADGGGGATYTAGQGLGLNASNAFSLNITITGSLVRFTTLSGSVIKAKTSLASSGTLIFEGSGSGNALHIEKTLSSSGTTVTEALTGATLAGFGLTDCDGDTQTLAWDLTTQKFLCGDDDATGAGLTQSSGDERYVNISGDTMTGALAIVVTGGNTSTISLETPHTISGAKLHGMDRISMGAGGFYEHLFHANFSDVSSGADSRSIGVFEKNDAVIFTLRPAATNTGAIFFGAADDGRIAYSVNDDAFDVWTAGISAFYINSSQRIGIGTKTPDSKLDVIGTISGTTLYGADSIRSSGALVWERAGSGRNLTIGGGNISLSTTGSSIFNVNSNNVDFLIKGDSDGLLFISDASSDRIGIGINPRTKLEVLGTISGSTLTLSNPLGIAYGGTNLQALPRRSLILTAGGATPSTTSGSVAKNTSYNTNGINLQSQDFVGTGSLRYTQWSAYMPDSYDGGTLTANFSWVATAGPSGANNAVKWYLQCQAFGSGSTVDSAWGSAVGVVSTIGGNTANKTHFSNATSSITCAGSPAGGKILHFRAYRDPADASDTLAATGKLLQIKTEFSISSYTD